MIAGGRSTTIDALKASASQLIVLHHLAFYGPMADLAAPLWPALFEFLARHARIAVQVFLVVAGFLAARSLAPLGRMASGSPLAAPIVDRYLRLVLPLAAMLVLAIAASAVARASMAHESVPAPPSLGQWLAHLLLLQDLLGIEALSAGVWYVAIDFQLFVLLIVVLAAARAIERGLGGRGPVAPWLVLALAATSLLVWNRVAALDVLAPYFFGAYGLGVLAAWWGPGWRARPARLAALALLVFAALAIEFRSRVALAALVALVLVGSLSVGSPPAGRGRMARATAWLAQISYALFLVHFPVSLVVNAVFTRFAPADPLSQGMGVLVAWGASVMVAAGFHRAVERPAMRAVSDWRGRRRAVLAG